MLAEVVDKLKKGQNLRVNVAHQNILKDSRATALLQRRMTRSRS